MASAKDTQESNKAVEIFSLQDCKRFHGISSPTDFIKMINKIISERLVLLGSKLETQLRLFSLQAENDDLKEKLAAAQALIERGLVAQESELLLSPKWKADSVSLINKIQSRS